MANLGLNPYNDQPSVRTLRAINSRFEHADEIARVRDPPAQVVADWLAGRTVAQFLVAAGARRLKKRSLPRPRRLSAQRKGRVQGGAG